MASLFKHPKSRFFTACYTNHEGKQVKRSTKQTNRNKALQIALEWEALEQQSRRGTLTTVQIQKVMSELAQKTTGEGITIPSVKTFLDDWVNAKETRGAAAGTIERYKNTVKVFLKFLGDKSTMPVNGITPSHIQNFMDERIRAGAAPKTAIVDIKTLSTALNHAEALMLILKNPAKAIELPKNVSSERAVFAHEQVIKIIATVEQFKGKPLEFIYDWKTLILLGYYTGARLSDCVQLKFRNIDFKKSIITYCQQKTGKEVRIPIHVDLYAHINDLINLRDGDLPDFADDYLCGTLSGKGTGGKHGLSTTFLQILKKAGIESNTIQGKGKRKFNCLTFHSLRHSFNTNLCSAGIHQEVRMKLTGHSSAAMNARYTHVDLTPLQTAIGSLPQMPFEEN